MSCADRRLLPLSILVAGCNLHPSNNDGGAINVATDGAVVFVARGTSGVDVIDPASGASLGRLKPSGDSDSYDDVAIADGLLFVLDADDGRVTSFRLVAGGAPEPGGTADLEVPVGPYSGIAAAGGRLVVSGGICEITLLSYDAGGVLTRQGAATGHRGHPDVTMTDDGSIALVSTHFSDDVDGHEFGLVSAVLPSLSFAGEIGLDGAGFTEGGGTPASWPARAAVQGGHVLVAHGGGLSVLSLGPEGALDLVAQLDVGIEAVDVALRGDRAFLVGSTPSPAVIEVDWSDPAAPSVVETIPIQAEDATPFAVAVVGDRLVVAAGAAGLLRFER